MLLLTCVVRSEALLAVLMRPNMEVLLQKLIVSVLLSAQRLVLLQMIGNLLWQRKVIISMSTSLRTLCVFVLSVGKNLFLNIGLFAQESAETCYVLSDAWKLIVTMVGVFKDPGFLKFGEGFSGPNAPLRNVGPFL